MQLGITSAKKRLIALPLVAVASVGIVAGTYFAVHHEATESVREQVMGDVVLTLEGGTALDTASLDGKPTVVVSWATWCQDCFAVLTTLSRVKQHFGDTMTVIAVNRKEEEHIVRDYRTHYPLPENITYTRDHLDAYYQKSSGQGMPEVVVYNNEGALVAHLLSIPTEEELKEMLSPLVTQ